MKQREMLKARSRSRTYGGPRNPQSRDWPGSEDLELYPTAARSPCPQGSQVSVSRTQTEAYTLTFVIQRAQCSN